MKLTKLSTKITHITSRNGLMGTCSFHSKPTKTPFFTQKWRGRDHGDNLMHQLYRRISPIGDPKQSVVPILDQWINEGNTVDKYNLQMFIKELRRYKRYAHALEISMWMSEKRYFVLNASDVAIRIHLMSKVHSIEQVEKYFDMIPQQLKGLEVYGALIHCYANAKSVDKAEAVMQKLRDLGLCNTTLTFSLMLNLYYHTGNIQKFDDLMHEMEEKGIIHDNFSLGIQLSACASHGDIERMEKTLTRMKSDEKIHLTWYNYSILANGYTKAGLVDKALEMLKNAEQVIPLNGGNNAYNFLLTQYASIGNKNELLRLWEVYQKKEKINNRSYMSVISSLLKFDDLEKVEEIFEEWESRNLLYDMRIPNFLIAAYSRNGLVEKAETFVDKAISKGGEPDAFTWYYLATGYIQNKQYAKAMDLMKKSVTCPGVRLKLGSESLASWLEYLKGQGDLEQAEQFIKLLLDNNIISADVHQRLLDHIRNSEKLGMSSASLVQNDDCSEPDEDIGGFHFRGKMLKDKLKGFFSTT